MFRWLNAFWKKTLSRKPWIEVISSGFDGHGMVRMEFDWNHAFIKHLWKNGFRNPIEEEAVQEWFQALSSERIVKLIEEVEEERKRMNIGGGEVVTDNHPHLSDPTHVEIQ
jgi:hypothetical protein